jgi:hypothetical protein
MIDARFRPLLKWTREPGLKWRQSHFKTAYNKTLDALEYELGHLQARNIVIEAGYRPDQIRNDGWPRGGVSPSHRVDAYKLAYRKVAAQLHPDKGGDPKAWHEFQNAAILLQKHHSGGLS